MNQQDSDQNSQQLIEIEDAAEVKNQKIKKPLLHYPTNNFKIEQISKEEMFKNVQKIPAKKKIRKHRELENKYQIKMQKKQTLNQIKKLFPDSAQISVNFTSNYFGCKKSPSESYQTLTEQQEFQIEQFKTQVVQLQNQVKEQNEEISLLKQQQLNSQIKWQQQMQINQETVNQKHTQLVFQMNQQQADFNRQLDFLKKDYEEKSQQQSQQLQLQTNAQQIQILKMQQEINRLMENGLIEQFVAKLKKIAGHINQQKYTSQQLYAQYNGQNDYIQLIEILCPLIINGSKSPNQKQELANISNNSNNTVASTRSSSNNNNKKRRNENNTLN